MKTKVLSLSVAMLFFVFTASAQNHIFKVISSKGKTEVKRDSKWAPITRGTKIYSGSKIRIQQAGYLGLVHKSGKPIQLKKQGEYDVATLSSKINVRSASFASKYGSYIASKMTGSKGSRTGAHMLGAVERASEAISILVQKTSKIRKSPTIVKWETTKQGPYVVTVKNLFDEAIYTTETSDKQVELNLAGKEVEGNICILNVKSKNDPNAASERSFEIITGKDEVSFNKELSDIEKELDLNNALDNFFYATYFEDKGLALEARYFYEKATTMEPEVEDYKKAYKEFLERQGIKG
ncbi:MAG: hypothetical protein AB8B61_08630 [Cyclobacteriaceae bacterium]